MSTDLQKRSGFQKYEISVTLFCGDEQQPCTLFSLKSDHQNNKLCLIVGQGGVGGVGVCTS